MANRHSNDKGLTLSVSAPGKIILHGEHSVVYGKLAIAGSLGLRTRITLTETNGDICTFSYKSLDFVKSFELNKIQNLLNLELPLEENASGYSIKTPTLMKHDKHILKIEEFLATSQQTSHTNRNQALTAALYLLTAMLNGINIKAFHLLIDTDLTLGAGCGSSASYSVCLAAIYLLYMEAKKQSGDDKKKTEFNLEEIGFISNWAYCAEKIMHGTPSGIDNTICAYGLLLAFKKEMDNKIIDIPTKINILLIDTKVSRNTRALVSKVRELHNKYPDIINPILQAMDVIAETALNHIKSLEDDSDEIYEKLGELAVLNHNLLGSLNVSHPSLDKICNILSENGLGGKLTGAGGGGYAAAIVPPYFDQSTLKTVMRRLEEAAFEVTLTDLGGPGITID